MLSDAAASPMCRGVLVPIIPPPLPYYWGLELTLMRTTNTCLLLRRRALGPRLFLSLLVNGQMGVATPLTSLLMAGLMMAACAFCGPLLQYLPQPLLGAVVIVAASNLVDLQEPRRLWSVHMTDFFQVMSSAVVCWNADLRLEGGGTAGRSEEGCAAKEGKGR